MHYMCQSCLMVVRMYAVCWWERTFLHLHGLSQSCLSFMSRHSSCNGSGLKKCNEAYTYTKWCQPLCTEHQSQSAFCTLFQILKCPKSWWVTCTVTMAVFFGKLQVFNSGRKGSRPSQPVAHIDSKDLYHRRSSSSADSRIIFLPILPTCPTQYQPRYCAIQCPLTAWQFL